MKEGVDKEIVIIGAGLGGLATGIRLLQLGFSVLILEKLDRAGGLCGTVMDDGYEHVIACNDFGKGLPADLQALGVSFPFERMRTRVLHEHRQYLIPPDWKTLMRLLPMAPAILKQISAQRRARRQGYAGQPWLQDQLEQLQIRGDAADILMLPAYLMGVSPGRFRLDALDHEFRFKYGYTSPMTPRGGPQRLVDALVDRFRQLGGEIRLGTEWKSCVRDDDGTQRVLCSEGELRARAVVSTLPQPLPAGTSPQKGLPASMLRLRLDAAFSLPHGIHTHVHYPAGIAQWFGDIQDGMLPERFGFHFFCSDLGVQHGQRTASVYFYAPHGKEEDARVQAFMESFILKHLDTLLPGIGPAINACTYVSPERFRKRHGFLPRVTPCIVPAGTPDNANHVEDIDMYFAGAASFPPGDHAGAAIRSAFHVAKLIEQRWSQ